MVEAHAFWGHVAVEVEPMFYEDFGHGQCFEALRNSRAGIEPTPPRSDGCRLNSLLAVLRYAPVENFPGADERLASQPLASDLFGVLKSRPMKLVSPPQSGHLCSRSASCLALLHLSSHLVGCRMYLLQACRELRSLETLRQAKQAYCNGVLMLFIVSTAMYRTLCTHNF